MTEASVTSFFDPATFTVTYVVRDPLGDRAAIVDPVLDYDPKSGRTRTGSADKVIAFVRDNALKVDWILETHAHADHLSASQYLRDKLGGKIAIGAHIRDVQKVFKKIFNLDEGFRTDGSQFDRLFDDGASFKIGSLDARVMHTPGHTPACLTYVVGTAAFVGDTLFMPDYGTARADFPGGDAATLYRSVRKILSLPDATTLYLCHDYKAEGRDEFKWITTVSDQRTGNVHVRDGIGEREFVVMREKRDKGLDMPVLILPSIQINIRAGQFPPAEENGVSYLKIPLNAL